MLSAASPAIIATGHFAFGYVLLLPSPLPKYGPVKWIKECVYLCQNHN